MDTRCWDSLSLTQTVWNTAAIWPASGYCPTVRSLKIKRYGQPPAAFCPVLTGIFAGLSGKAYQGYEIHMGVSGVEGNIINEGNVYGTYIHGVFDKGRNRQDHSGRAAGSQRPGLFGCKSFLILRRTNRRSMIYWLRGFENPWTWNCFTRLLMVRLNSQSNSTAFVLLGMSRQVPRAEALHFRRGPASDSASLNRARSPKA